GSAITGLLTPLYLVRAPRPGHGPHPHRPTPTTSRQLNRNREVCTAEGSQVRILPTAWLLRMCHQRSAPNSSPEGGVGALLLGPVLRHVSDPTALVWVQTESPATVVVLGCS